MASTENDMVLSITNAFQEPPEFTSTITATDAIKSILLPATTESSGDRAANTSTAITMEVITTTNPNGEPSLEVSSTATTDETSSALEEVYTSWLVTPARGKVRTTYNDSLQTANTVPTTGSHQTTSIVPATESLQAASTAPTMDNHQAGSDGLTTNSPQITRAEPRTSEDGASSDEARTKQIPHEDNRTLEVGKDSDTPSSSTSAVRHFQQETATIYPGVLVPYSFFAKSGGNLFNRFGKPYCPGCDARLLTLPPRFTVEQLPYLPWFADKPSTQKP
ncbi:unnamed protein product, partial [Ixodes hexagonus]